MERNYSNRDFEQYVKQNADQYRMFPSEKVWKGVHSALHRRRRWYGLGLAFLFLVTGGAVTWVMHTYPATSRQAIPPAVRANAEPASSETVSPDIAQVLPFGTTVEQGEKKASAATPATTQLSPAANSKPLVIPSVTNAPADLLASGDFRSPLPVFSQAPAEQTMNVQSERSEQIIAHPPVSAPSAPGLPAIAQVKRSSAARISQVPSIEDVSNTYKAPRKRLNWQLFFTPTISYRKLSINKSVAQEDQLALPFATLRNVNGAVTHKPDLGFQLGANARYPLTKALRLRAGFQFNVNRYDIQAYYYASEVATIDLAGGPGQTVTTWTNYRNATGYKENWLKNYYLSVAVPVGAELTLFNSKNKKTSFGVAGTIQPTYVVSDRAYLISTDYKNYAKVPWLIRNVNLSTGFEAFVNYGRGNTRWQVGPQVRYQLLSSFQKPYPVKENLFDFGVKIGVSVGK